jgi:hypothetical protein
VEQHGECGAERFLARFRGLSADNGDVSLVLRGHGSQSVPRMACFEKEGKLELHPHPAARLLRQFTEAYPAFPSFSTWPISARMQHYVD